MISGNPITIELYYPIQINTFRSLDELVLDIGEIQGKSFRFTY